MSKDGRGAKSKKDEHPPHLTGVEQSEEALRWIWENFLAVDGDQPSFGVWRMSSPSFSEQG